jgi:HK97 family phage major capsid protein
MKTIQQYLRTNQFRLFAALGVLAGLAFGLLDPVAAAVGGLVFLETSPLDEILKRALAEHGTTLKKALELHGDKISELKDRMLSIEQSTSHKHGGGGGGGDGGVSELAQLIVESENTKGFLAGRSPQTAIEVPGALIKTAIINATGSAQPLVAADRRPGIVASPERQLRIRDLFAQIPTTSNMIEFCKENVYTDNAGPQGGTSPISSGEGEAKNESGFTFTLSTAAICTLAHWVPASRQVLSDAPMLERYLSDRLLYGMKLEEEDELLNGTNAAGQLNGLITQATTFTGGATNQTALDTIAKSIGQLAASEYSPSAIVLHPGDWFSSSFVLAKDTTGRYLLGDPHSVTAAALWGIPCVITNSITQGQFLTLDAPRAGFIADREVATVRISEHHSDFWVRNLVAILCELRVALVVERAGALITGNLSYAG